MFDVVHPVVVQVVVAGINDLMGMFEPFLFGEKGEMRLIADHTPVHLVLALRTDVGRVGKDDVVGLGDLLKRVPGHDRATLCFDPVLADIEGNLLGESRVVFAEVDGRVRKVLCGSDADAAGAGVHIEHCDRPITILFLDRLDRSFEPEFGLRAGDHRMFGYVDPAAEEVDPADQIGDRFRLLQTLDIRKEFRRFHPMVFLSEEPLDLFGIHGRQLSWFARHNKGSVLVSSEFANPYVQCILMSS